MYTYFDIEVYLLYHFSVLTLPFQCTYFGIEVHMPFYASEYINAGHLIVRRPADALKVIRKGLEPLTRSLEGCCSNPTELPNHLAKLAHNGIFHCLYTPFACAKV